MIHRRYPTPVLQVVAKATVGVIALLALLLSIPLLAPDVDYARGYWRLVWVVVILDLLGTVVVPLSNALFRPRATLPSATWPVPEQQPAWSATPTPAAPAPAPDVPLPPAPAPAPARASTPGPAPETVVASDGRRYASRPSASRALAWPRYVDGTPLPALPDGTPDFSEVTER